MAGLSKSEINSLVRTIFEGMIDGKSDHDLANQLGLDLEAIQVLRQRAIELKAQEHREKPQEHHYVEYVINQIANIRELTKLIKEMRSIPANEKMVAAIRARSDIYDKLVAKAQEFGVIDKTPDRKEVVAGVLVGNLTNDELRKVIVKQLKELNSMMATYGDNDFVNVEIPNQLHHGPKLLEPIREEADAPNQAKTKVNKGRKRRMPLPPGVGDE